MSMLIAVVQAATPAVTATPLPTPAEVAAAVSSTDHNQLLGFANDLAAKVSQTDIVAAGAALAVAAQGALNKVPFFKHAVSYVQDVRRFLLAVFIPSAMTVGAGLATGHNELHLAPIVFLGAQVLFYAFKFLVGKAVASFSAKHLAEPATTFSYAGPGASTAVGTVSYTSSTTTTDNAQF